MGVDNFFVVGGACVATPNFVTTPYYWITTMTVVLYNERMAHPFWQKYHGLIEPRLVRLDKPLIVHNFMVKSLGGLQPPHYLHP